MKNFERDPTLVTLFGNFVPFIDLFSRKAEYRLCFCSENPIWNNPQHYGPFYMAYIIWPISYISYNTYHMDHIYMVTSRNLPKMTRSRQTFIFANKNDQKIIIMITIITAIDNAIMYWSGIFPPWFNFLCFSDSE